MHYHLSRLAPLIGAFVAAAALVLVPQLASAAPLGCVDISQAARVCDPALAAYGTAPSTSQPAQTQAATPSKTGTVVVYVGGLGDTVAQQPWGPLINAQGTQPWTVFSYTGAGLDYSAQETCQPIATSEAQLKTQLDALRPQYAHAILVGHSLGGVLGFDVGSRPDEADFVSKIITVDAPLNGIGALDSWLLDAHAGFGCQATADLHARQSTVNPATTTLTDLGRGQHLLVLDNKSDWYLPGNEQAVGVPAVDANVYANDSGGAHSAALRDPTTIQQIAQFIAS